MSGERARPPAPAPAPARVIHYWDSPDVPPSIADVLASFCDLNPDFEHLLFDESRALELIAAHFGPREVAAFRSCAVPAMQADYFRYCAIHALGGVYSDVDLCCVAPLRSLVDVVAGGELFQMENGIVISGFFAFRAGHPLLRLTLEVATANVERRVSNGVMLVTGPGIFTALYLLHELGSLDAFADYVLRGRLPDAVGDFHGAALLAADEPDDRAAWAPAVRTLCEVVGDHGRVVEAFEGVNVSPLASTRAWVREPEVELPYKDTDAHWVNFAGSIYR